MLGTIKYAIMRSEKTGARPALFLAVVIIANLICTGPMSSMLDLVSETSYLTEATTAEATELVTQMAEVEQLRRLQIHQHERYGQRQIGRAHV